jgi:4-amino-4-deoxy-L-arabinose transferase-like glycosyltransferase
MKICLIFFTIFLIIFRIHNAWHFNPFWGYDGGGHIDYILSLAQENRFPSIEDNYVAWHEPLYYLIYAGVAKIVLLFTEDIKPILKTLSLAQVVLSLGVSFLVYRIIKQATKNKLAILSSFIMLSLLPAMTEASTFLTNELLNYFFIFLIITLLIDYQRKEKTTRKNTLALGIVCGLALLTKVTAVIPIAFVGLTLMIDLLRRHKKSAWIKLALFIVPVVILVLPWQIYRAQNVLAAPSINNQNFLEPMPLKLDERVKDYTWFDADIFKFPYWYSGGRAFSSMFYADSFYDYYGMMENDDLIAQAPAEDLVRTTVSNTYVTKQNFSLTSKLVWLAIVPAVIMLWGMVVMIALALKKKQHVLPLLGIGITASFFSALIYFSYRYHYFDMGIVKSIFIYPVYLFPIIYGFASAQKNRVALPILGLLVAPYLFFLVQAFWVQGFNY